MKGYSELKVFTEEELDIHRAAWNLVDGLPMDTRFEIRCHELARAVFKAIPALQRNSKAKVIDGKFGGCEHSWISMVRPCKEVILDVYAVGTVPMVQLIDLDGSFGLVGARRYVEGTARTDIDETRIQQLLIAFGKMRV